MCKHQLPICHHVGSPYNLMRGSGCEMTPQDLPASDRVFVLSSANDLPFRGTLRVIPTLTFRTEHLNL